MASEPKMQPRKNATRGNDHTVNSPAPPGSAALAGQTAARRASTRSLANLLRTLQEFVLMLDSDGTIRNLWSSKQRRLRRLQTALLGRRLEDLVSEETFNWIKPLMDGAIESGRRETILHSIELADGMHSFAVGAVAMAGKPGIPKTTCLVARDITMWKTSREALLMREALLAQAEELANVGSWELDLETDTLNWSAHFYHMLGLPPEQGPVPPDRPVQMIHPDDRERALRDVEPLRTEGKPLDNELRFMTAHRGMRIFHSRAIAIRDGDGRIVRIRGMSQDVTEQREAEEKLREREAMLAHAEEIANCGSWQFEFATRKVTLSPNLRRIFGFGPDTEWTTELYWSRVHPEDRDRARAIRDRCTKEGKPFEYEVRFLAPEGAVRFFHVRGVTILDSAGKPLRRTGVLQDITERREADEKLREREALLAHAEKIANLGSWQTDLVTQGSTASPNINKILGVSPDTKVTPAHYWDRVHPEDRARARAITNRATEEGKLFEYEARFLHPDGGLRYLHIRGVGTLDAAGRPVRRTGVVQDVTEQREAEEKLREREALLAHAEEIANLGSFQYDVAIRKAILSPNLRKIYGLSPDAEWHVGLYYERVHPKDRDMIREVLARSTAEGKTCEYVARMLAPEGCVRFHHVRAVPILDSAGKVVRRIGVVQDITEQVRAEEELRRLSQQLLRARDEDRRHIARELHESAGQSLAALKMTLGQLREHLGKNVDLARALLKSATELADTAIREVRTVSYLMHPPMLDEAGLGPALRWYARGFAERSGIQVQVDIPENLPRQSQEIETTIFRIVQEALTNVHRYSGSRTAQIRLACQNGDLHAEVRDTGCGLVQPSRTLGAPDRLGVGIAGMRERVKQLNGVFELESAPGKGTIVRVTLPVAAPPARSLPDIDEEFGSTAESEG